MTRPVIHYTRCPSVPTISALAEAWGTLRAEFAEERDVDIVFQSVGFSPKTEYDHKDRFWLRNAGHAPAIWKKSHGVDCKVVGLAFLDGRYPVLSLHSSGLAQPAALKGKRLAVFYNPDSPFDLMIAQQLKIYQTTLATVGWVLMMWNWCVFHALFHHAGSGRVFCSRVFSLLWQHWRRVL